MRWAGNVARMEYRIAYRVLVENLEVQRQFGRPRRRWQNNFRINLKEVDVEEVDWIHIQRQVKDWYDKGNELLVSQNAVDFLAT